MGCDSKLQLKAWKTLSKYLHGSNEDQEYWWKLTGRHVASLLEAAEYPLEKQYECLFFHYRWTCFSKVPDMGPAPGSDGLPTKWKSLLSLDSTSIEYSWKWNTTIAEPDIRYVTEPIGQYPGTELRDIGKLESEAQMARRDGRDIKIDTQVIRDELFGFYMAGQETTSTTLCWAMRYLTANLNVQTKLRTALREAHVRAHRNGDLPSAQEIAQTDVPYLEAFIQEVHRVGNSVSSIVRVTTKDAVVLGHNIPEGTDVFMLTNGPNYKTPPLKIEESIRSKTSRETKDKFGVWDNWSIKRFIPERWLIKNEEGRVVFNPVAGYTHPYGAGPRACFGMKWAQLMLKSIITIIVWSFEFAPLPPAIADFKAIDVTTHRAEFTYLRPVPIH
ncbi:cytochrome P450, putative [Talaromyces stipitatus ATCC 10500]|uniref:Cytochrome P450, putative n=1 Tax=Talaromyces stipitatus (strain ATCC 10500 / CBS 375.48 / QM 6759 / NRRL 1006) TaxID=441959 RepID=B8MQB3_TALSN|nr:cytochrome P450, putative [Talaromyces stipitatus ATCC 10500]EED13315.1 cytochrome P450, putative [Talaromyces stipitatus ATCC 10500]